MNAISPEDYLEPPCPLERPHAPGCGAPHHTHDEHCGCGHHHRERIPVGEIIAKCDAFFNSEQMGPLGDHLRHWLARAREIGDEQGELTMLSELMGHYRMTGDRERGLEAVREGFELMKKIGEEGTVSAGTILLNGATALQAFGETEKALNCYAEAFRCYGAHLDPSDGRFAGLFNNMAAAYAARGDLKSAETHYLKALDVLKACGDLMDAAVTYVNLAQLYAGADPADPMVEVSLDCAMDCFDSPDAVRDGYYAHTCRKCASAFGAFGRPETEKDLDSRADSYYAGH